MATHEEQKYLEKWILKRYRDFDILYVACHGSKGRLDLGKEMVGLEDIPAILAGRAAGRTPYFGSCSTLDLGVEQFRQVVRATGAKAVVGYVKDVDWLDGAAFKLLLPERLLRGGRTDAFLRHLTRDRGAFAESLGLLVVTKAPAHWPGALQIGS